MSKVCRVCGTETENDLQEKCSCCGVTNKWATNKVEVDLQFISNDKFFIDAMKKLHDENPIEYQLKLQQLRAAKNSTIEEQEKQQTHQQNNNQITCPKCGSTNITEGTKGFSLMTGFVGSGNFRYVCKNCGNKWKPGSMLEALQRANNGN